MQKQKIKHYYGLGERQLRRYFNSVAHKKGNTGEQLLMLCERRLDNVIRCLDVRRPLPDFVGRRVTFTAFFRAHEFLAR